MVVHLERGRRFPVMVSLGTGLPTMRQFRITRFCPQLLAAVVTAIDQAALITMFAPASLGSKRYTDRCECATVIAKACTIRYPTEAPT
ncbi:hypothetical protein [Streptomyces poonensis]|uniref:Uncharacterized protein n=1 Tax=Streptomyces poonensis TaxID=68255 RepID=A0A918UXJ3_9ACTN|nr:hypothetical protein [Streptomyces poonensis]GGZ39998.1 hypothetical protein GCM10010365_71050 [Streptomyces poonensis]GLJ92879.1 hypothetical protein GCM10017589_54900 [Streptomyces poonensis]